MSNTWKTGKRTSNNKIQYTVNNNILYTIQHNTNNTEFRWQSINFIICIDKNVYYNWICIQSTYITYNVIFLLEIYALYCNNFNILKTFLSHNCNYSIFSMCSRYHFLSFWTITYILISYVKAEYYSKYFYL